MQVIITGTADEIATAIARIGVLLTVYEQTPPEPADPGPLEVRVKVQL